MSQRTTLSVFPVPLGYSAQQRDHTPGRTRMSMTYVLLVGLYLILAGCSSQESRENLGTLLCWLRPSCLPSHSSSVRTPPPPKAKTSQFRTARGKSQPPCRTTEKTTITKSNPSITVSYEEPDTQADGTPLTNLAKTSIYRNDGDGFIKIMDVPATRAEGGGTIKKILSLSLGSEKEIETTICVTATNRFGREG